MSSARPHSDPRGDLEPLLYSIHASTDANADWRHVLGSLGDRLGGRLATFSRHDFATGQGVVIWESPETPRFRTDYPQYAARNPWFLSSEAFAVGRVVTGDELLSNRELVKTDFFRGLLQPHGLLHCLCGVAARRGLLVHCVNVHRGEQDGVFGEREKATMRTVLGHLSLALENRWRQRQSDDLATLLKGAVDRYPHPTLLVDADGGIVHGNRSAVALAGSSVGLHIEQGRLKAAASIDRAALREAIRDVATAARRGVVAATRAVTLSVPGARYPVVVSLHAAGQAFRAETGDVDDLVLVTGRSPQIEHDVENCSFVKQFALSPAQARVSVMIVTGHSLIDTARKLHVSENTARSHLKQVFQKTNTHGQMELVHLHARHCVDGD